MQFYEFGDALRPLGEKAPEKWENALAVLTSREAEEIPLPPELVPPEMPPMVNQTQFCVLKMQQKRMTGSIHIPARHQRRAIRFTFAWSGENLLLLDDGGFVSGFIERSCSSTLSRATQGIYSTWNPGWTSWRSRCLTARPQSSSAE